MKAWRLPSQETNQRKLAADIVDPEIPCAVNSNISNTIDGVGPFFSPFFIDIIKVTEVQYAILITTMNCFIVEQLNITASKQTIASHSRLMH